MEVIIVQSFKDPSRIVLEVGQCSRFCYDQLHTGIVITHIRIMESLNSLEYKNKTNKKIHLSIIHFWQPL